MRFLSVYCVMIKIETKYCLRCKESFNVNINTKKGTAKKYCNSICSKKANGENNKGKKRTDDFKKALSEKVKGEGNSFFGKKHKPESLMKMSESSKGKNSGQNNYNWKGGFREGSEYLRVTDGRFVHRIVMAEKLGRELHEWENVHHIDENKRNNHPDNLEILSNSEHRKLHSKNQKRDNAGKFTT